MEIYRKKLKGRMRLLAVLAAVAVGLGIYDVFFADAALKESYMFGFQCGAVMGLGLIAVAVMIRTTIILRDPKKLQLACNQENDERLKAIRAKAGVPMLLVTSVLMIVAGSVAAFFNTTVFATLLAAAAVQMLMSGAVKLYYMQRM